MGVGNFNCAENYFGLLTIYVNMSSTDDKYAIELLSVMMGILEDLYSRKVLLDLLRGVIDHGLRR